MHIPRMARREASLAARTMAARKEISFCACPTEVIVDPIVAGKWSVSAVNEIRSITTPAHWGGVTE
jgi:hypothetical protein